MMGLLLWKEPREGRRERTVTVSERAVLHMRFLCGEVLRGPRTPEAVARRRVRRAAKQLRKLGVTQAVLPEKFPYREELAKLGDSMGIYIRIQREEIFNAMHRI